MNFSEPQRNEIRESEVTDRRLSRGSSQMNADPICVFSRGCQTIICHNRSLQGVTITEQYRKTEPL
jgi:hypothetical protein